MKGIGDAVEGFVKLGPVGDPMSAAAAVIALEVVGTDAPVRDPD